MRPATRLSRKVVGLRWRVCEGFADGLQRIVNGLDECTLAEQHRIGPRQQAIMQVLAQMRDQVEPLRGEQGLGYRLGNGARVPKEVAKQALGELGDRRAVVDVARR